MVGWQGQNCTHFSNNYVRNEFTVGILGPVPVFFVCTFIVIAYNAVSREIVRVLEPRFAPGPNNEPQVRAGP